MRNLLFPSPCCTQSQLILRPWWKFAGFCGMRHLGQFLKRANPRAYGDTLLYFDFPDSQQPPLVALTIDDGLVRGTDTQEWSMVKDVMDLLAKYDAQATFFVCTDYVQNLDQEVRHLLQEGHELGNHLQADKCWYYPKLRPAEFAHELRKANAILEELEERCGSGGGDVDNNSNQQQQSTKKKTRWFRAPQGIMTKDMANAVAQEGNIQHVLGDCYCDDWCFAQEVDPLFDDDESSSNNDNNDANTALTGITANAKQRKQARQCRERIMKQVANIMLAQAQPGSIAILHMPEKGFRQGNLLALEYFLQGVQKRGWKCVNLTQLQNLCDREEEATPTR